MNEDIRPLFRALNRAQRRNDLAERLLMALYGSMRDLGNSHEVLARSVVNQADALLNELDSRDAVDTSAS